MGTNAVVSLVGDNGATLIKAVCGCNGDKAKELAEAVQKGLTNPHLVYSVAMSMGFGCRQCLVVVGEYDTINRTGDELGTLYHEKFKEPRFNPRWQNGTASHVEIVKFDNSTFDRPEAFGEECEWIVVRGDIEAIEAAPRLNTFAQEIDLDRFFHPGELKRCNAFLAWDESESSYCWRLDFKGTPSDSKQVLEVWYVDENAGIEDSQ